MNVLRQILVWAHVLTMVGAFGGLMIIQFGLPRDVRDVAAGARIGPRLIQWMLAGGLVAGLLLVLIRYKLMAGAPGAHFWGVVGLKFLLLLAAGATVGISARKLREGYVRTASRLRIAAIVSLALAALFGATLS